MVLGSTITGKLLDKDYVRIKRRHLGIVSDVSEESTDIDESKFPIEHARLRMIPVLLLIFVASVIGWGWSIQTKTNISVPLVLQIIRETVAFSPPIVTASNH